VRRLFKVFGAKRSLILNPIIKRASKFIPLHVIFLPGPYAERKKEIFFTKRDLGKLKKKMLGKREIQFPGSGRS